MCHWSKYEHQKHYFVSFILHDIFLNSFLVFLVHGLNELVTMDDYREGSLSSSYYSILGVSSDSSLDEIRRAYRKLAMVS